MDADPNANLNEALGLGWKIQFRILEDTKSLMPFPPACLAEMFIEFKLSAALAETNNYDLLVMGNPQGSAVTAT